MPLSSPEWIAKLPIKDQSNLDAALSFLQEISVEDRVAIIYDPDGDGISAAAVTVRALKKWRGKRPEYIHPFPFSRGYVADDLPEQLKKLGVTKLITLDKSVDQMGVPFLLRLGEACETLIIDHHRVVTPLQMQGVIIAKPDIIWETESSSFPTAMFAYTLFSHFMDVTDSDWIACIGIVSDAAYPRWKDFVDASLMRGNYPVMDVPFENAFGRLSGMIYATGALSSRQLPEVLDLLIEANSPKVMLDSGFMSLVAIMEEEMNFWLERLPNEMEYFPELELHIGKVKPRHNIKSILINKLSQKMPNQTILLLEEFKDKILISGRRQDFKVPINVLLETATRGLPEANGGGHVPAAGGIIRAEDEAIFMERVKAFLRAHAASAAQT
ncbi:MAG: DHH family phosphoesterase [Candidatus Diapherotrites archaeon]|nr:DHH family phosphoesterase [Candidatus Diapherotrites archaeon]MDZ4256871.1 DHH family phosphoesterase [archaeon]